MSNEIQNALNKFKLLSAQKNDQELSLMKIKCELRELKSNIEKMKAEKEHEDIIYGKQNLDQVQETPLRKKSKRSVKYDH